MESRLIKTELEKKVQGNVTNGNISTNFPDVIPPPGILYSANFCRALRSKRFSVQTK